MLLQQTISIILKYDNNLFLLRIQFVVHSSACRASYSTESIGITFRRQLLLIELNEFRFLKILVKKTGHRSDAENICKL